MKNISILIFALCPVFIFAQQNVSNNPFSNDQSPAYSPYATLWEGVVNGTHRILKNNGASALPSSSVYDRSPKASNNVTWIGFDGNDDEIFYHNLSTGVTTQLSDNSHADLAPLIFKNSVTWYSGEGTAENDYEVYYYDGNSNTVIQITNNNYNDINPRIVDQRVVWQTFDGHDWEICYYQNGSVVQLTNNTVDDINPELGSSTVVTPNIVWQQYDGQDYEIMYFNSTTLSTSQITHNAFDDERPNTWLGNIAWTAKEEDDYDIFYYNGVTIKNVSNNNVHDELLFRYASIILWRSDVSQGGELFFLLNGNTPKQLTYNNREELEPSTNGKIVLWASETRQGDDQEIYKAVTTGTRQIELYPLPSTVFQGEEHLLDFEAYGNFISNNLFTAQLSTINSEEFPADPLVLATSNTSGMTFNVPHVAPGEYRVRIVAQGGGISNSIPITISTPDSTVTTEGHAQELIIDDILVSTYPNPFNDQLNVFVTSPYQEEVEIKLLDFSGQTLVSIKAQPNTLMSIQESVNPGLYFLQVSSKGIIRTVMVNKG